MPIGTPEELADAFETTAQAVTDMDGVTEYSVPGRGSVKRESAIDQLKFHRTLQNEVHRETYGIFSLCSANARKST